MKKMHRPVSILLILTIILGLFLIIPVNAGAAGGVEYIYRSWNGKKVVEETRNCTNYTDIAEHSGNYLAGGWYVVTRSMTLNDRLFIDDFDIHIILCDGATLTCKKGICIKSYARLHIYGQSGGTGKIYSHPNSTEELSKSDSVIEVLGTLYVFGGILDVEHGGNISSSKGAAIGCTDKQSYGNISIYGGKVSAKTHYAGAAIGGGGNCAAGNIRIYGGEVKAESSSAAAIGNGEGGSSVGSIEIYGGVVDARTNNFAAAIGGSESTEGPAITVNGGNVTAINRHTSNAGAGIGSGLRSNRTKPICIKGGYVFAQSTDGAAIGAGNEGSVSNIEITGGAIIALSTRGGAGIGGGSKGNAQNITIRSASVSATSASFSQASDFNDTVDLWLNKISIYKPGQTYEGAMNAAAFILGLTLIKSFAEIFADDNSGCGIGAGYKGTFDNITIADDSLVTAKSGSYAAAIGSADENENGGGTITISDSVVEATAGSDAAAIGTGNECDSTCSKISISGSTVNAYGGAYGAGIGGGDAVGGGNISITGSTVKAYAGEDAAAIGGGEGGDGGKITILNSNIYAEGKGYGAGIGNGEDGNETNIEINGSNTTVEAFAGSDGKAVAIGQGGNGIFYTYSITRSFNPSLLCDAGSDKSHTARYHGDDRYTAAKVAKYMYLFPCEHNNRKWVYDSDTLHVPQCTECELCIYSGAGYHDWDENNVCTVCGGSAVMREITFVEQDANGNQVTFKQSGPVSGTIKAPVSTHAPAGMEFVCWSEYGTYYAGAGETIGVSNQERTFEAVYLPVTQTTYIDRDGAEKTVTARRLTHTNLELTAGRYVVESNIQSRNAMTISGDVELILADGATFSFYQGFDYSDLDHIDCLITAQDTSSTLSVYGQTQQTGTLLLGKRHTVLTDFAQYGGVVDSKTGFFESTKNCQITGGSFKAAVLACDRAAILGGNAQIGNLPLNKSLQLGWRQAGDTIHFDRLESEETSIVDGQAVQDESGNIYKGILSNAQVEALAGKTLTSALEHQYGEPEWVWADEYTNASAIFHCRDCGKEVSVNAKVSVNDEENIRTSTATCVLNGETYTTTHTTKLLWDITVAQSVHGTIGVEPNRAKAGDSVSLIDTPDKGYRLDALVVKDSKGNAIEVENNAFKMPESNVTVSAAFVTENYSVTYQVSENGRVTGAATARYGDSVTLSVEPSASAKLVSLTVTDAAGGSVELINNTFTMPASDVTVSATFAQGEMVEAVEPYIDALGAYILGNVKYFAGADGKNYAVNANGTIGEELESVALSYFDFALLSNGTYQINFYTGPTDTLEELVIPKTFNGKAVTVLGNNGNNALIDYTGKTKTQFSLVLNENITEIKSYTFYTMWVKEVKGDTSRLSTIGDYAFSWANSRGGYALDISLEYPGTVSVGGEIFNHMIVTARMKHATRLSKSTCGQQSISYAFTDAHTYGEPVWNWAEENTLATASFTCTDTRCNHRETVNADVTHTVKDAVTTHTAIAEINGNTYTDTVSEGEKANNGVNLTLGGDITSNYYIDYTKYTGAASITYTYNSVNEKEQNVPVTKTIDLSDIPAELSEGKCIKLTVSQAPAQMAETTHIEILNAKGEVMEALDYSAKSYCDSIIAMSDETLAAYAGNAEGAARLKTLTHSLIAYAEAAQGVFAGYETTKVTCESDAIKAQIAAATATPGYIVNNAGQVKFSSVSFACTKDARLRLFLNTQSATSIPAAPETDHGTAALKYTMKDGAKQYFVEVSGIDAVDFDKKITVTYGGSEITLSVLDFCGIVLKDGSGASNAMQHLAKALVVYNINAESYFS